jgi:sec-independent protein translocase protein TatB
MFDISWTEFLLIGVVALIVIGPKELPGVMRSLGQWTRKVRSMASEFQNQFQEAMREAEMSDLKQQVDDIASDVSQYDPLKSVREDVEAVGEDVKRSLSAPESNAAAAAESVPAETSADSSTPGEDAALAAAAADNAAEPAPAVETASLPPPAPAEPSAREIEPLGATAETGTAAAEKVAEADRTERTG